MRDISKNLCRFFEQEDDFLKKDSSRNNGNDSGSPSDENEVRRRIYFEQVNQPRDSEHHIVPSSRASVKMRHLSFNKVRINRKFHNRFHMLFLNRVPEEILDLLVYYFWGGKIVYVKKFLLFNSDSVQQSINGNGRYGIYWKNRNYQKRFENQIGLPINGIHRIVPLSRGGAGMEENIVRVNTRMRDGYREGLFMDRTPEEILDLLVNYFWDGEVYFLKNYLVLLRNLNRVNSEFTTLKPFSYN